MRRQVYQCMFQRIVFRRSIFAIALVGLLFALIASQFALAQGLDPVPLYELDSGLSTEQILDLSSQFNDRLLATVYWSLGTVLGLVTVVLGVNWFFGFRSFERDREALHLSNIAELSTIESRLRTDWEKKVSDLRIEASHSAAEARKMIADELQKAEKAMTAARAEMASSMLEFREYLEQSIKNFAVDLKSQDDQQATRVAAAMSNLQSRIRELNTEFRLFSMEVEADKWEYKDVPANEITYRVQLVLARIADKQHGYLILSELERIEHLIGKGAHRRSPDAVNDLINGLPDEYALARSKIVKLVGEGEVNS